MQMFEIDIKIFKCLKKKEKNKVIYIKMSLIDWNIQ